MTPPAASPILPFGLGADALGGIRSRYRPALFFVRHLGPLGRLVRCLTRPA